MAGRRNHRHDHGRTWMGERRTFAQEMLQARAMLKGGVPDTTLEPCQFFARAQYTNPLQRLAVAIVESALRDYARPKFRGIAGKWIKSDDAAPFSLRWTCDALALDFGRTRAKLMAYATVVDNGGRGWIVPRHV
jgi:hypothetical protein